MKMHAWTADMVRFMRDASEHTDFYEALADELIAALGGAEAVAGMRLCDAGCGLGYLSLALASRAKSVAAVDIAQAAIAVLRDKLDAMESACNIEPRLADIGLLPDGERFDAMIFCMFGRLPDVLEIARGRCDRLVIVKKNWTARRFAMRPDVPERDTLGDAEMTLEGLHVPYSSRVVSLSLDQPFRSLKDAMLFFRIYGAGDPVDEREVRRRLVPCENAEFPWLLPVPRELGILTIDMKEWKP